MIKQWIKRSGTPFTNLHSAPTDKWISLEERFTWAMQSFWRNWQDMAWGSWRNYLGIYGATDIVVASQTSNNRNIPFNRKRNIWLGYFGGKAEVDQWNGIDKGWEQGTLEHGKKICSSSKSNEVLENQTGGKNERNREKEKVVKTGVSQNARML